MADMTSQRSESDEALLPTRQELIDYIVKLMPIKTHNLAQSTEHGTSPEPPAEQSHPSIRNSVRDVSCVKDLLKHHSQNVYQLQTDDYSAQIDGQLSFGMLVTTWELATKAWELHDSHQFPNVRNGLKSKKYTACTVQCTCLKCGEGDRMKLVCEPYAFGTARGCWSQVLVHKLHNDPENRAIILGWGSESDTYLIWGPHPTLSDAMAYNQNVVLQQVHPEQPKPSHSSRPREQTKKRRASNSTDPGSEARKQPKTDHRQHRPFAPSPLHQSVSIDQLPLQPDLQQAWRVIMDHIIDQEDQATGLSIMFSNHKLQDYMMSAEATAERDNAYLFRTMREIIDEELAGTGFPRLPTM